MDIRDVHLGQRVRLMGGCDTEFLRAGEEGTVLVICGDGDVGVEWDNLLDGHAFDSSGPLLRPCRDGAGLWMDAKRLEPVDGDGCNPTHVELPTFGRVYIAIGAPSTGRNVCMRFYDELRRQVTASDKSKSEADKRHELILAAIKDIYGLDAHVDCDGDYVVDVDGLTAVAYWNEAGSATSKIANSAVDRWISQRDDALNGRR